MEGVSSHSSFITEFVRILQEEDNFPAQYFFDVRPSLKRIRVEGMYLDEQELFDLRSSLETIRAVSYTHLDVYKRQNLPPMTV